MKDANSQSTQTRRSFLTSMASAGAALSGAIGIAAAGTARSVLGNNVMHMNTVAAAGQQEPLFRFVQINDLHVKSLEHHLPATGGYKQANEKAQWVVEAINNGTFGPLPDFVIAAGDMIHGQIMERLAPDLKLFQEIVGPLRCPLYPAVGNHEVIQWEQSAEHLKAYVEAFGADRVNYTFARDGIHFIVINNGGGDNPENGKRRRVWLRKVLEAHKGVPVILVCHEPLLPMRELPVLIKSFGFTSYMDRDPGMLPLIEEYSGNIIAVLSGHLHLTGMKQQKGIVHITLSGTASYPSDGALVYEVYPDRIEARVHGLPTELAEANPTIHGKPRFPEDFTDVDHSTGQVYQRGRDDERHFVIPLPLAKRPVAGKTALAAAI